MRTLTATLVLIGLTALPLGVQADPLTPANDEPSGAVFVPATPTSIVGTNLGATTSNEDGCKPNDWYAPHATVWYSVQVPIGDWSAGITVNTIGSTLDTYLGVYWSNGSGLYLQVCNDNDDWAGYPKGPTGKESRVRLGASPYEVSTYFIEVGGVDGAVGQFQLNFDVEPTEAGSNPPDPLQGAACFGYNPAALTNACVQLEEGEPTNVPTPNLEGEPIVLCILGPICVNAPGIGMGMTPVANVGLDGYVEATILCGFNVPCRVDLPDL